MFKFGLFFTYLINIIQKLRSSIPNFFFETILSIEYYFQIIFATLRGLVQSALGRCRYDWIWRPFFIGPKSEFQMEKGACIRLTKRKLAPESGASLDMNINEVSALGFRVHWKFMNPPASRKNFIRLQKNSELHLGPNVSIMPGAYLSAWPNQHLIFEEDVATGTELYISTSCGLRISKGTMIGHQVTIMDYDGHPIFKRTDGVVLEQDNPYGGAMQPITIGPHVWIGFRCTILKGVTIGEGAIIGANSVVTRDIPPFTIAAGNPAKVILEEVQWRRY